MSVLLLLLLVFLAGAGCSPEKSENRKQAAALAAQASWHLETDPAQARDLLVQAVDLAPEVVEYQYGVGLTSIQLEDWTTARSSLETVLPLVREQARRDPERVDDLTIVLAQLGRWEEARRALQEGAARFPDDPQLQHLAALDFSEWLADLKTIPPTREINSKR